MVIWCWVEDTNVLMIHFGEFGFVVVADGYVCVYTSLPYIPSEGCAINVTEAEPRDKNAPATPQNFTTAQWAQYYAQQGWLPSMLSQQPVTFPQQRTSGQTSNSSSLWSDSQTWAQQAASYQQQQQQQTLEQRAAYQFSTPGGPTVPGSQRPSRPPF